MAGEYGSHFTALFSLENFLRHGLNQGHSIWKVISKECAVRNFESYYTGSLVPADFSGAVFSYAYFQKIHQISSLCDFDYINEGIPSLICFWLLMT